MPPTDTSEKGLESLIVASLVGPAGASAGGPAALHDKSLPGAAPPPHYVAGNWQDYDRDHAVDTAKLLNFLETTQPKLVAELNLAAEGPSRHQFLDRLQGEIAKRGVVDVLRKGIKHGPVHVDLFYGTPTPGNAKAAALHAANIFSVTRQLRYSKDNTQLALDLCLFINGLPVATFELKNKLTKQTVEDAINQYKRDRSSKELLFQFGRCMVHFAVDDHEVWMCTELKDAKSWFLPFNKGYNDGAGNPPNPSGLATDYLWKEALQPISLTNIIENYAQIVEEVDRKGRKKRKQIFPRYHQLDLVRGLLAHATVNGVGHRYLIEHSAGSGKSNSISWLGHQLVELKAGDAAMFDSIIVVTDRRVLDKQIRENIRQFAQVSAVVGAAMHSGDLRKFIEGGKKIIITTIQKFPFILDEIGSEHRERKFAIIIDEAHSSQGGRTMAKMHAALSKDGEEAEEETYEDKVNRIMESRKLLVSASYFAFTATPKNKTLELFGVQQADGSFRPFHSYTMKQAIQEGFILDVLAHYTPVSSYYRLIKKVDDDPEFDVKRAQKKLRRYVESNDHAIRRKAEIMIDHFHEEVLARKKLGGQARAMIVTSGIARAIQYKQAFDAYLAERKSPYKAIVAYSGEHEVGGKPMDEAAMNGFPSSQIEELIQEDPYRFLIVADKFQTGYDEPLLHTMYVDKILSGGKAVQTLSRLNRAHPLKHDTFVLDFVNDAETIREAFEPFYRTTILSEATDPNKIHDLKAALDARQVYAWPDVENLVQSYLGGADRDQLDPILDTCVVAYKDQLDEDAQVEFKGNAKIFVRTYSFLATVLPYTIAEWEKLSIFLNFLIPKLPAPKEDDLSKGILETIDMDSYRVEVKAQMSIALADEDGKVGPVPTSTGGGKPE
ncbi:MAG TPA: type I restriction endonuclease subunit R, partial [Verrucomicrobiota bacterium]|nr:type I restriction endonuclease subunit R [Verrucomicrobiota bacterium]